MTTDTDVGKFIRKARTEAGLTQTVLAGKVGVTQTALWAWEKGRKPIPPERMEVLCAALGIPMPQLPDLNRRRDEQHRGKLAEAMVPVAAELACMVREEDREAIGGFVAKLAPGGLPENVTALLVVLAAMVPVERPVGDLLAWVTWDESGRPVCSERAA